jgi:predicted DsbA family dithiol-disulfide isomerase
MLETDLRFAFDYVDPGSYLAAVLLERYKPQLHGSVQVTWIPLELSPPWAASIDVRAPAWTKMTNAICEQAKREAVLFHTPVLVPRTRKAHELALHAKEKGCFEAVHRALFEAQFQEGTDIGRIDVLVEIGAIAGLERSETRTVLGVDRFGPVVSALRSDALAEGIRGVPTITGPNGAIEGFQDSESFFDFLETVADGGPSSGDSDRPK